MTKVIDTLTQEDFNGDFQKLLERFNKFIAAGEDYFEGNYSFMCVLEKITSKGTTVSCVYYQWEVPVV